MSKEACTIVLKIGGSFLLKDGVPQVDHLRAMATTVRRIQKEHNAKVVVVVGGGVSARNYIMAAGALGVNAGVRDFLGILVSRLNARVFIEALGSDSDVYTEPPESLQDVRRALSMKSVVVTGGLQPGQSTTAVAALCAEYCGAKRVIYATDVDGVYSADPNKDKNATKFSEVSYAKLRDLTQNKANMAPGQYQIMDGVALNILERSSIPAQILKGEEDAILRALGGETVGTLVVPESK